MITGRLIEGGRLKGKRLLAWQFLDNSRRVEFIQPRPQANSRYPSNRRRLGTERDIERALRLTSSQNSPGTTGDEAGIQLR